MAAVRGIKKNEKSPLVGPKRLMENIGADGYKKSPDLCRGSVVEKVEQRLNIENLKFDIESLFWVLVQNC